MATLFLLLVVYFAQGALSAFADPVLNSAALTLSKQAAPVLICMLTMTPFMIWDLIKPTNRIAGPLFRFETLLHDFGKTGKLNAAVPREGDLLTDYQQRFNAFVAVLHAQYPETQPVSVASAASVSSPVGVS